MTIVYHIDVLHPETLEPMSHESDELTSWEAVERRIRLDKARFLDRSSLPIKYTAYDGTVELSGSFGVA